MQRSPEATAILNADQALQTVAASADGTKVVTSGFEGALFVWDTESRQRMTIPNAATFVKSLDISLDGRYVALVGIPVEYLKDENFDSRVVLVDLEQTPPSAWVLEGNEPSSARFAADGRTIVTVGEDGCVRDVDMQTGAVTRTLDFALPEETALVDTPENRRYMVAAAEPDTRGPVLVWEVETGLKVWSSDVSDSYVAAISPDGSKLVLGHTEGRVEQVDLNAGGVRTPVPTSLENGLVDVAFSPSGSTFAGVTQERTVVVWDAGTLETEAILRGHSQSVTQAVYSPDGNTIYASGDDLSVLAWDLTGTKGIVTDLERPGPGVTDGAMAPDRSILATRYSDGRVVVLDVATGETFEVNIPGDVDWISVDRIGRYVLVFTRTEPPPGPWSTATVHVIDVRRQVLLPHTFDLVGRTSQDATVTWDGRKLLTAAEDRIDLWNLATGDLLSAALYEGAEAVSILAVHPDERLAALGENGGIIEVIDLETGELVETLNPDLHV